MLLFVHCLAILGVLANAAIACGDLDFEPDHGIEFVTVGDVGNPPYEEEFGLDPDGRGSVPYEFRISRTEVTCGQYLGFFNLFYGNPEHYFTLLPRGDSSFYWIGPGVPLRYANGFNDPASAGVQLTWRQAAMFCNWMHNGQRDDWESLLDGAYDVSTFTREPDFGDFHDQPAHHPDARYWIPSLDEYLKAAFYDPDKNGNGPGWWNYGHSSDVVAVPGLPGVGEVARDIPEDVIRDLFGPATEESTIPLAIYPDVQSPWGLLDVLGGNKEWIEDWEDGEPRDRLVKSSSNRTSGSFAEYVDFISNLSRAQPISTTVGFRIASAVRHPADLNNDWETNFFDVSVFIDRFTEGDLSVDFDGNGEIAANDVVVFLELIGH